MVKRLLKTWLILFLIMPVSNAFLYTDVVQNLWTEVIVAYNIEYVCEHDWWDDTRTLAWAYHKPTETVFMCNNDYDTYVHEIGHHFYFHHLTQYERDVWELLWRASLWDRVNFVSDYAMSSSIEDFAEVFKEYSINWGIDDKSEILKLKWEFIWLVYYIWQP